MRRHPVARWFLRHRWTLESAAVVAAILAFGYAAGAILAKSLS